MKRTAPPKDGASVSPWSNAKLFQLVRRINLGEELGLFFKAAGDGG